jgi:hypothetical protein
VTAWRALPESLPGGVSQAGFEGDLDLTIVI